MEILSGGIMTYRFDPNRIYRMPTHFGPAPGPRQMPDGIKTDSKASPRRLSVTASFLTDAAPLERHLPEGFALAGEPVVSVEFHYMTDIDWLAGRGYTMIWVSWPATFTGRRDHASGKFLAVVWENLADPIITGRCEIGHPKLYAEIQEPRLSGGVQAIIQKGSTEVTEVVAETRALLTARIRTVFSEREEALSKQ